jgi:hypothetical protein
MSKDARVAWIHSPISGNEPDGFQVVFRGVDGSVATGSTFDLPAGKLGTWEITFTAAVDIRNGGGFCFFRRGFLMGHAPQLKNPLGRDYVTLESNSDAEFDLAVNSDHGHEPEVARVHVSEGILREGDWIKLRVGDRCGGGPGAEVYDSTTIARLEAAVDRRGSGSFVSIAAGATRIRITSDASADMLRILGPSIVEPGEPFHLNLIAFDLHRNVCEQYRGIVQLMAPDTVSGLPDCVEFEPGHKGALQLADVQICQVGIYRLKAWEGNFQAVSNPIFCQEAPDRRLLWGDFHSHAWGDTSMALMDEPSFKLAPDARHRQARDVGRLDFAAPGPMSPPDQADEPELWEAFQQAYTKHDEPGKYVPFLASEVHTRSGGDRNVVYREMEDGYLPTFSSKETLLETYGDREDVILESHVGGGPPNWEKFHPKVEPLLEVASGHGAFEWLLQKALRYGYRPAVIGSGDIHLPTLGAPMAPHCFRGRFNKVLNIRDTGFGSGPLAGVWATYNERNAIWQAVAARRTFATTGARIILKVSIDDDPAGSEMQLSGPARVRVVAHACSAVQRVDLIRNDRRIKSWRPNTLDVDLIYVDEHPLKENAYYVRLRQDDGEFAWSTPIWARAETGGIQPAKDLPLWNAHEEPDQVISNGAEDYVNDLINYLEVEENPKLFSELMPAGMLDEVTGRSALFYAYLEPQHDPVSIRWYYEFAIPRMHLDWGWHDFGAQSGRGKD